MRKWQRRTDEECAKFRKEYEAGETLLGLCAKHDLAQPSMLRLLRRAGTKMRPMVRPTIWTKQRIANLIDAYRTGLTLSDVGKLFGGLSRERVRQILAENGEPTRQQDNVCWNTTHKETISKQHEIITQLWPYAPDALRAYIKERYHGDLT